MNKEPAAALLKSLQKNGSWLEYNYDEHPKLGLKAIGHLQKLVSMCIAYRSKDSVLFHDKNLKDNIHTALNFWYNKDPETDHHWFNEIGVPRELTRILILMEHELSTDELTKGIKILKKANVKGVLQYGATKATGQNMIWIARIQMEAGCLDHSAAYVSFSVKAMEEEIIVTTQEGIQVDWSFHQHGPQLYSGGYGLNFSSDCAEFAALVNNTKYELGHEQIDILSHYILDGQQWMTRGITLDYGTMGREIARLDKDALPIALACDDMATINTSRRQEFIDFSNRIKGLQSITTGPLGNRHFWRSDFMIHQRPLYYTSVKMASERVNGTESGNGEADFNYHLPDGSTYLVKTGEEYRNIFPLWDWQKIPGVTARQSTQPLPIFNFGKKSEGKTSFVGGVSDGKYGMSAFDFDKDAVKAKKAWFYFDHEYVCLGTGINSNAKENVFTTVNQCFSKGEVTVSGKLLKRKTAKGSSSFKGIGWVYQGGTAYLFPTYTEVQLSVESRSSDWQRINTFISNNRTEKGKVFTLWMNHGIKPLNQSYSYIVIPDIALNKVPSQFTNKNILILSNNAKIQAVMNQSLKLTQIAFYEAGRINLDNKTSVEVDQPCLLMIHQTQRATKITVSDPENKAATVKVKVTSANSTTQMNSQINKKPGNSGKVLEILYELPDGAYAGQSITKYLKP